MVVNGRIRNLSPGQETAIDEVTGDSRRGDHDRRHQVRPASRPLASLEISIGRRGASFAGWDRIAIHPDTHRTARGDPFQSGITKYPIETLLFPLLLYRQRSGRHQAWHARAPACEDSGSGAQVFNPAIGAR